MIMEYGQLWAQRQLRGWSQEDVVRRLIDVGIELGERQLGVTRSQVSRWERGVTHPRAPYPKLLCHLFQLPADELGLVAFSTSPPTHVSVTIKEAGSEDVERRELLRLLASGLGGGLWAPGLVRRLGAFRPVALKEEALPLEAAMSITDHYRHVIDSQPAQELVGPLVGHIHFVSQLLESSRSPATQTSLATAVSEACGFVSRLAFDLNDPAAGWNYHRSALAYAERAESSVLQAYHLADMSLWAGILGDGDRAVQLVEKANSLVAQDASLALQAWFAAREASAYSRAGNRSAALHALDRAEALAGQADAGDSVWPWTQPFGRGGLAGYRGAIGARLKLPDMALPALQEAFSGPLRPVSKYHALVLGDLASSYLPAGEVEESARLTAEAFDIGTQLGSYRVLQRVREVRSSLNPYRDTSAVRDLDERMAGV
jgi:transcriptional regulator with XRE-family HTH domain